MGGAHGESLYPAYEVVQSGGSCLVGANSFFILSSISPRNAGHDDDDDDDDGDDISFACRVRLPQRP